MSAIQIAGAGPVGLACALAIARRGRSVRVVGPEARGSERSSVESVPSGVLALLIELGVHPKELGVEALHTSRTIAWEAATPETRAAPRTAHIERPALDRALLRCALAHPRVEVIRARARVGARVIDATGRRAVTARTRLRPEDAWIARTWTLPAVSAPELAIAALPGGYAYRLGSRGALTVGLVGPAYDARGTAGLCDALATGDAAWLVDGLPLDVARREAPRVASVQLTQGDDAIRIGDAALARDAMSSQGIATGLSEALAAAAALEVADGRALFAARQREQKGRHLEALTALVASCRFCAAPAWRAYGAWLAELERGAPSPAVALRDGALAT